MNDLKTRLDEVEGRIRDLREERAAKVKQRDEAKAAYDPDAKNERELFATVKKAAAQVTATDMQLAEIQGEQSGLLGELGDLEAGMPGEAASRLDLAHGNGWAAAAKQIDVQRGALRADIGLASVLAQAPTSQRPPTNGGATAQPAAGNRWLFPVLPSEDFPTSPGNEPEFVASDYTADVSQDAVSGVERDVDATTEKSVLPVDVNLAVVNARQFAIVIEDIPSKVFEARRALQDFLGREVARRLNDHFDLHVVEAVESGSPPTFTATGDLVADVRRAVAEMQDRGGLPRYLALDPATAADLDLSVQPGTGDYVFRVDLEGSGSPTWSLAVRVVPSISAPSLVDPAAFIVFLGAATLLLNPYTGMSRNLISARIEYEAAAHRRSLVTGVTTIA